MNKRLVALCCAVALVASACGSKASNEDLANNNDNGGATSTTAATGTGDDAFGTLENPCSDGPATPAPSGTTGVTDDEIKVATITDKVGQVKLPTASIEESTQAFIDWCNGYGGIKGRKLKMVAIDSKLFSHLEATKEACNAGVFAIVGSGSVTDNTGAQAMVDCGLIEVPAYTATVTKAMSDNMVQPVPNPGQELNGASPTYVAEQHPKAVKKAAILASNIETATAQADRLKDAYEQLGFEFIYTKYTGVVQESYAAEAREMKNKGVEYVTMVSAVSETNKLLRDMKTQQFEPEVIDLGAQYYDPELLTNSASEGAQVQLNTVPFEEADQAPALQQYLDAYDAVDSDIKPTSLGVQAFSAGLLFATAAAAVDELTRDNVLAELKTIHSWDGGGLHYESDPGGNKVGTCIILLQVKDSKFTRLFPDDAPEFSCNPDNAVKLEGDYGDGATLKDS